jgi:hypothetical protein
MYCDPLDVKKWVLAIRHRSDAIAYRAGSDRNADIFTLHEGVVNDELSTLERTSLPGP